MNNTIWSYCGVCQTLTEHEMSKKVHITQHFMGNKLKCLICKKKSTRRLGHLFKTKIKYRK